MGKINDASRLMIITIRQDNSCTVPNCTTVKDHRPIRLITLAAVAAIIIAITDVIILLMKFIVMHYRHFAPRI